MSPLSHAPSVRRLSGVVAAPLGALLSALVATAPAAYAEDIRHLDPSTCAPVTTVASEIVEENWLQISYRVRAGQPVQRIETRFVLDIKRPGDDPQAAAYAAALAELEGGAFEAARTGFASVGGGGRSMDPATGRVEFKPFPPDAGKARWHLGYSIYHYALASYREGIARKETQLLEDALRTLDADKPDEKGYLVRYKEGRNRWYADAMLLRAQVLVALGRHDEAATAFDALYQRGVTTAIGVRFAYEAKLGAGRIAEAKGELAAAETAYEAATSATQSLLEQAQDPCSRADLGRFYNETRMEKARILRQAAEKEGSSAAFGRLRTFLEQGTPEALRQRLSGRPAPVVDAVLAGALAPSVQAVAQNGIGLAHLAEKRYSDAIWAFTQVRIKYFSVADEVPRALHYLAKAADAAAAATTRTEAKTLYQEQAAVARKELAERWKGSPWITAK